MVKRKQQSADDIYAIMFKMALMLGAVYVVINISTQSWMAVLFGVIVLVGVYALMKWVAEAQRSTDINKTVTKAWYSTSEH